MTQLELVTPLEFVLQALRMNPDATFDEVKARGLMEGVKIHPITFGRAKTRLGLQAPTPKRLPRPEPKTLVAKETVMAAQSPKGQVLLAEVLERVRTMEAELQRYRAAIEEVRCLLRD